MQLAIPQPRALRLSWKMSLLVGLLLLLLLVSLSIGALAIGPIDILQLIGHRLGFVSEVDATQALVLFNIRLPRLLLTVVVGAVLGLSGASLQGIFRNPLVEPGTIGVSSGSALGVMLVILLLGALFPSVEAALGRTWIMALFAFLGGVLATLATLQISRYQGRTQITYLILAGVAITALAQAGIGLAIFYADDNQLRTYTFWTLGDLSTGTWGKLSLLIPLAVVSGVGLLWLARPLNALALGESEAYHSGVPVERVKLLVVFFSALAVGTSVAFVGIIGFVGLVVPHIVRMGFSSDHRVVLPASAIGGSILLLLSDIFARTVVAPAELPIGVVTAAIGTPFFIYLLISAKKKRLI